MCIRDRIPSISIVKLSQDANVSTASIVRTMKKLGYDGFTSFKHDLKKQYRFTNEELSTFNSLEAVDKKIQAVVVKNEQEVRRTIEQLDSKTIEDAEMCIRDRVSTLGLSLRLQNKMLWHKYKLS